MNSAVPYFRFAQALGDKIEFLLLSRGHRASEALEPPFLVRLSFSPLRRNVLLFLFIHSDMKPLKPPLFAVD